MKKVLSVMAVSAFVLTASSVFAGGPGKQGMEEGCPEECQQQIDDLQSSQAQQNEQLGAHSKQLEDHEARITKLEEGQYYPWYARVGVKMFIPDAEVAQGPSLDGDLGWGGEVAFGRKFGNFRVEGAFTDQKADLDDDFEGDVQLQTIMLNGYYDYPVWDALSVYGTIGMGFGKYDLYAQDNDLYVNGRDTTFVFKGGFGVSYAFTDQMAADLGYEYVGASATTINDTEINDIESNNVVASFRFMF